MYPFLVDGLQRLGNCAFSECGCLKIRKLPSSLTYIGNQCFSYCGIDSICIPEGVTELFDYSCDYGHGYYDVGTFTGCSNLKSISIPSSMKRIGDSSFDSCENLKEVTISVKDLDNLILSDYTFSQIAQNGGKLYVHENLIDVYKQHPAFKIFKEIAAL